MTFVNISNFRYLCDAFTFTEKDVQVLDSTLAKYDEKTGLLEQMVDFARANSFKNIMNFTGPQLHVYMDIYLNKENGSELSTTTLGIAKNSLDLPPLLMLNLHSPSMNVPQRIEIPLRYVLKGLPPLGGTHMVYLHAIEINDKEKYIYYGRTKRGWMKRFNEHVKLAMKGSNRKFPALFGEAMRNRYLQLEGQLNVGGKGPIYTGSHHVVCGAGYSLEDAKAAERYLIDKRSLSKDNGLNMV